MTNTASTAGFFVLRTPLLPVETLLDWSGGLGARAVWERGEPLAPALAADRTLLRARLVELLARPEVREAIFIASPSLDEAIPPWLENPDSERGSRAERALVRYFGRMCARPTPFGLFAGISTGRIEKETRLAIDSVLQEIHRAVEWRARRRLPRWITLGDDDNRLPVDLENILSVDAFGIENMQRL